MFVVVSDVFGETERSMKVASFDESQTFGTDYMDGVSVEVDGFRCHVAAYKGVAEVVRGVMLWSFDWVGANDVPIGIWVKMKRGIPDS